jgi:hypothetical protein
MNGMDAPASTFGKTHQILLLDPTSINLSSAPHQRNPALYAASRSMESLHLTIVTLLTHLTSAALAFPRQSPVVSPEHC